MNILFVCKYNRFRSRIAEAYFNKINTDKSLKAISRGIIRGDYPLNRTEVSVAKKLGLNISGKPKSLTIELLKKTDLIVIVANNVPKEIFYTTFKGRVLVWEISDIEHGDGKDLIERKIKRIIIKVKKLLKKLEKDSFRQKIQLRKEKAREDHLNGRNHKK
jgi:protein-tyrosine-phosphatase